jgi:iron complex outermembrane receptor protein
MRIAGVTTALATVAAVATLALAQQPPPAESPPAAATAPTLSPVVVEGPRFFPERLSTTEEAREEIRSTVPGGAEVIGEQTIRESLGANLRNVLDFTPGVLVRPRFGLADESQFSIRGSGLQNNFHNRDVNFLFNGFIYGQADGFSDFESVELMDVKRIEVYKGANALRFGGNSIGGAVNFITKTGYDAAPFELWSEGGSYGFFKQHLATGQVYGPFDFYGGASITGLDGYRSHSQQQRYRFNTSSGWDFGGGMTARFDLGFVRSLENLPGALTRPQFEFDPQQRNPSTAFANEQRNYNYPNGGFTFRLPLTPEQQLVSLTQLNYQDLFHPLAFAIIDQTTYNWSQEVRYINTASLGGYRNLLTAGFQYFGTNQNSAQLQNRGNANAGPLIKNEVADSGTYGLYAEDVFAITPAVSLVLGGRLQYSTRDIRDRLFSDPFPDVDGNDSGSVDYFGATPKVGAIWQVTPTVQVYGNASRAYQPPILLELTAPGQIPGTLDDLKPTYGWQFEIGTRGNWGERANWDISVYDYELWDEIQNVNVQPFPGAPFTIPRFQNIPRSRHLGVEVGLDVQVLTDIARALKLGRAADQLRARVAYTYSNFRFVNNPTFNNNFLPGAPEHFIRAEVRYESSLGFYVAPQFENVPKRYPVNSTNFNFTSPYALVGIQMGYTYKPWNASLYFQGTNLANKSYISAVVTDDALGQSFYPGDGRGFYGGLQWRW